MSVTWRCHAKLAGFVRARAGLFFPPGPEVISTYRARGIYAKECV